MNDDDECMCLPGPSVKGPVGAKRIVSPICPIHGGGGTPGPARQAELEERFMRLLALDAGWDSYGARRISAVAVQRAWDWWAGVIVVPCSDGGVQLEWHRDGVEVEIILREAGDAEVFSAYSWDSGGLREAATRLLAAFDRYFNARVSEENSAWDELSGAYHALRAALAGTAPERGGDMSDGVARIAAERRRQVEAEGWSAEHDDSHTLDEMALSAAVYACPEPYRSRVKLQELLWAFGSCDWKPGDRIRELEKAGALIAAEIDRLLRAAARAPGRAE